MTTSFIKMMAETQREAFVAYAKDSDAQSGGLPGVEVGGWLDGAPILLSWMPPDPRVVESAIKLISITTGCDQLAVIGDSTMVDEMNGMGALWKRSSLEFDADMVVALADREGRWQTVRQPYTRVGDMVMYGAARESGLSCARHQDASLVNTMVNAMVEETTSNRYLAQHGIVPGKYGVTDEETRVFSVVVGQIVLEEMNCTTRNFIDTDCLSDEAREAIIRWLMMQRSRTAS